MRKSAAIKLSEKDDGKTIEAPIGREIELRLAENPTAGFRWRVVQEGKPVFELMEASFKPGGKPGEPGVHIRRYRVTGPGKATLKLNYVRSWEAGKNSSRSFRVAVNSKGK